MEDNKPVIIAAVIAFAIGIIFGINLMDKNNEPDTEIKNLLSKASSEIDSLKKENNSLKEQLERLNTDSIKNTAHSIHDQLKEALIKNESLTKQISGLRAQLSKTERELKTGGTFKKIFGEMRGRISSLEKENSYYRTTIDRISSLSQHHMNMEPAKTK